jgi:DNA-binding IclR family transcriptional regulator
VPSNDFRRAEGEAILRTRRETGRKAAAPAARSPAQPVPGPAGRPAERVRSTTADLLYLVEQLSTFDQIGVTRLARHLEVPVPTAYRMLRALERAGYVEQLAGSREYRLTLKLFELGSRVASRTTLRDPASHEVERLARQCGLATSLSVLAGGDILYLAEVRTGEQPAVSLPPGSRAPATCTAMGKAMLAVAPGDLRAAVGPGPYPSRTEHSVTSYDALVAELAEVRRLGYALDRQELSLGVWCVAAPIRGTGQPGAAGGQPAAISVCARRRLDPDDEERLGQLTIIAASRIASRLAALSATPSG